MARGVVVTCRAVLTKDLSDAEAVEVLRSSYDAEPFVDVTNAWPSTKPVTGTNRALVSARVDPRTQMLICSAAIDNLGKGAAGQAIQNANIALGIDETTGLEGLGVWP
jgi:N-acetyl-gamma-glutamyl-phosphate reductase